MATARRFRTRKMPLGILLGLVLIIFVALGVFAHSTKKSEPLPYFTTTVDPIHKTIREVPDLPLGQTFTASVSDAFDSIGATLSDAWLFTASAFNPSVAFVNVRPGMRKEEIAAVLAKKLNWTADETKVFAETTASTTDSSEGKLYPSAYVIEKSAGPEVKSVMLNRFKDEVTSRYPSQTTSIINMDTALKIASIIEREAGSKSDMRLISGVIWNRIFNGMKLEMDATLQYVKGTEANGWWPKVVSDDKKIDSPYNTYKYAGFPPTAIASPSIAAIDAALNPKKTTCLFYLHDRFRRIHCAETYDQHLKNIKKYL